MPAPKKKKPPPFPEPPPPPGDGGGSTGGSSSSSSSSSSSTGSSSNTGGTALPISQTAVGKAYTHLFAIYGFSVSNAQIRALINGSVSIAETQQRLEAVKRISEYKPAMDSFEAELRARGLAKQFSFKDRLDFVLGLGPKQFYDVWEMASARTAATTAGFMVSNKQGLVQQGKGGVNKDFNVTDLLLGRKDIRALVSALPGLQDEQSLNQALQQAAQLEVAVGGLSRAGKEGLNKRDILLAAVGMAPVQVTQKIERLQAERQARQQPIAVGLPAAGAVAQEQRPTTGV